MAVPVQSSAQNAHSFLSRLVTGVGLFGLLIASFVTAWTGNGVILVAGILGLVGVSIVVRRPTIGVGILMTTFLFTYPAALRGIGNLTINNVLGLLLIPLMLYEMIRNRTFWIMRFRPFFLIVLIILCLIVSAKLYGDQSEYVQTMEASKVVQSQRAQGPALIETRDAAAKLVTRFIFLVLFVFFVRTNRDMQAVAGVIIAALLITYFSVTLGSGSAGWGTGRLRALGEAGESVSAAHNPNKMAFFGLWGLTMVWYFRHLIRNQIWYPIWAAVTAITVIIIPLTGSRSGMLNLIVFVLITLLEGRFHWRKIVGLIAIGFLITVQVAYQSNILDLLLPAQTAARLEKLSVNADVVSDEGLAATGSAGGRFRTAEAALRVWSLHPAFGVGIGNFESERARTDPFGTIGPPHNSYLWALAEGGLAVFVMYAVLFLWTLWRLHMICWNYEKLFVPMELGWLARAQRTLMICFAFFSLFADMWYHDFFWIIMAMNFAVIHLHDQYAITGIVPTRFTLGGGSSELTRAATRIATQRAVVVRPSNMVRR